MVKKKRKVAATAPLTVAQVEKAHNSEIESINNQIVENNEEVGVIEEPLADMAERLYGTRHYSLKSKGSKKIVHMLVLAVVAFAEIPVNYAGLQMYGLSRPVTLVLSVFFGICFAIVAEFGGKALRRAVHQKKGDFGMSAALISGSLFCIGVAFVLAYYIAKQRTAFFHHMHYSIQDVTLSGQFLFAMGLWFAGFIAVVSLTSGVKNVHEEEEFLSKIRDIIKINKKTKKLSDKKNSLIKNLPKLIAAAENAENAAAYDKLKNENLKLEANNLEKVGAENQLKEDAEKKLKRFNESYDLVLEKAKQAKEAAEKVVNKADIKLNQTFSKAFGVIKNTVKEMVVLAKDVPDSDQKMVTVNNIVNELNALI